jgi:hypothetical protein
MSEVARDLRDGQGVWSVPSRMAFSSDSLVHELLNIIKRGEGYPRVAWPSDADAVPF